MCSLNTQYTHLWITVDISINIIKLVMPTFFQPVMWSHNTSLLLIVCPLQELFIQVCFICVRHYRTQNVISPSLWPTHHLLDLQTFTSSDTTHRMSNFQFVFSHWALIWLYSIEHAFTTLCLTFTQIQTEPANKTTPHHNPQFSGQYLLTTWVTQCTVIRQSHISHDNAWKTSCFILRQIWQTVRY
jgi:hypothetical protein